MNDPTKQNFETEIAEEEEAVDVDDIESFDIGGVGDETSDQGAFTPPPSSDTPPPPPDDPFSGPPPSAPPQTPIDTPPPIVDATSGDVPPPPPPFGQGNAPQAPSFAAEPAAPVEEAQYETYSDDQGGYQEDFTEAEYTEDAQDGDFVEDGGDYYEEGAATQDEWAEDDNYQQDEYAEDGYEEYDDQDFDAGAAGARDPNAKPFYIKYFTPLAITGVIVVALFVIVLQYGNVTGGGGGPMTQPMQDISVPDGYSGTASGTPNGVFDKIPSNTPDQQTQGLNIPKTTSLPANNKPSGGFMNNPDSLTSSELAGNNLTGGDDFPPQSQPIDNSSDAGMQKVAMLSETPPISSSELEELEGKIDEHGQSITLILADLTEIKDSLKNGSDVELPDNLDEQITTAVNASTNKFQMQINSLETKLDRVGGDRIADLEDQVSELADLVNEQKNMIASLVQQKQEQVEAESAEKAAMADNSGWVLRGAQPDRAWVTRKGSGSNMRMVKKGDQLSGIGIIQTISKIRGKWVIVGSDGEISQ